MARKIIKSLGVLSVGKIYAAIGVFIGLIFSLIALLFGNVGMMMGSPGMAGFGIAAIILYPIILSIGGFINGIIMAFVYNLAANWIGGLEVDLE